MNTGWQELTGDIYIYCNQSWRISTLKKPAPDEKADTTIESDSKQKMTESGTSGTTWEIETP